MKLYKTTIYYKNIDAGAINTKFYRSKATADSKVKLEYVSVGYSQFPWIYGYKVESIEVNLWSWIKGRL